MTNGNHAPSDEPATMDVGAAPAAFVRKLNDESKYAVPVEYSLENTPEGFKRIGRAKPTRDSFMDAEQLIAAIQAPILKKLDELAHEVELLRRAK